MLEVAVGRGNSAPETRYPVLVKDAAISEIAELTLRDTGLSFDKKVKKAFEPWFDAPYSAVVRIRASSPRLVLRSPDGKLLEVTFRAETDGDAVVTRLQVLAPEYWTRTPDAPSAVEGRLAPVAPETECAACGQPAVTAGQNPYFLKPPDESPRYCLGCGKWFHKRCSKKSTWSSDRCPSCQGSLTGWRLFCVHCKSATATMHADTWPNFRCINCSRPASLLALEAVGSTEVLMLVAIGAVPAAAFVATLVYDAPTWLKWIAGLVAAPVALPWIAQIVATVLAAIMPGSANVSAPGAGGVTLSVSDARAFKSKPRSARMKQVYIFYVQHTIPALFLSAMLIVFILAVTDFARK